MSKPRLPITANADNRPRVYFRVRGDCLEFASHPAAAAWSETSDVLAAIDTIGGEGAWRRPAVIIWEGETQHA